MRTHSPLMVLGLGIVAALALMAVLAPVLSPYDPHGITGPSLESPSARHFLGTNDIGQDILSQLIWGARSSLGVATAAAALAMAVGVLVGVGAGLRGGLADLALMRVVDVFLAAPLFPLLVLIAALTGSGRTMVIVVLALLGWPETARIIRSQTLTLRQRGFVQAAAGFGGRPWYVVRRHLLPALGPLALTSFVTLAGAAIFLDAALAFLGLGDPTGLSWGHVLFKALRHPGLYFTSQWTWWVLPAGSVITLALLGFTFFGVGLETRTNPRWARV